MRLPAAARDTIERVRRRIGAERWVIDAVRRGPRARHLRRRLERARVRRVVRSTGSADAALDAIVADAIRRAGGDDR